MRRITGMWRTGSERTVLFAKHKLDAEAIAEAVQRIVACWAGTFVELMRLSGVIRGVAP